MSEGSHDCMLDFFITEDFQISSGWLYTAILQNVRGLTLESVFLSWCDIAKEAD